MFFANAFVDGPAQTFPPPPMVPQPLRDFSDGRGPNRHALWPFLWTAPDSFFPLFPLPPPFLDISAGVRFLRVSLRFIEKPLPCLFFHTFFPSAVSPLVSVFSDPEAPCVTFCSPWFSLLRPLEIWCLFGRRAPDTALWWTPSLETCPPLLGSPPNTPRSPSTFS